MSVLNVAELRRLSEAATPGEWYLGPDGMENDPPLQSGGRDLCYATINEEVTWPKRSDLALVAYLGTHRERIIAILEAADALRDAADGLEETVSACVAYDLAAKGGA